jgi:hypothetical protein
MGIQIELATVFTEPVLRRCWLLSKALENAPLDEALRLARAADEFLGGQHADAQPLLNEQALQEWLGNSVTIPNQASEFVARPTIANSSGNRAEHGSDPLSTTGHSVGAPESPKNVDASESDPYGNASIEISVEEVEDEPDDNEPQVAMTSGLAVLAGMDDVVRYLRQQDDVVVSAGTGAYLVNGRFQLKSDELLARANKIRQRQGKPQFERIPSVFPPAPHGGGVQTGADLTDSAATRRL